MFMPSFILVANNNELYCYSKGSITPTYSIKDFIDVLGELIRVVV